MTIVHEAVTQATLVNDSLVGIYSAMFVYALAFIFFTYDLAKRMSAAKQLSVAPAVAVASSKRAGQVAVLDRPEAPVPPGVVVTAKPKRSLSARLGMIFTVMAWLLHVGGTVLRGVAAGRSLLREDCEARLRRPLRGARGSPVGSLRRASRGNAHAKTPLPAAPG